MPVGPTDLGFIARWTMRRLFLVFGVMLFAIGVILAPTPIPIGVPLMLVSAVIIVNTSTTAKRAFLRWLRRRPVIARRFRALVGRRRGRRRGEA